VEALESMPTHGLSVGVLGRVADALEHVVHDGHLRKPGENEGVSVAPEGR
jgi:hypothetical protein